MINVDLAGGTLVIRTVRVSAFPRPVQAADEGPHGPEKLTAFTDPNSGSRFTALRQFAIEVCRVAASQDCEGTGKAGYTRTFTSPGMPSTARSRGRWRRRWMKSFNVPDSRATHVRLVVVNNQCTGFKGFDGEQDSDPLNATDCRTASDRGTIAHTAERQVFG